MKIRKELWFGFSLMAVIVTAALYMLLSAPHIERGHIGLLMLSLVVVAIMLGFPTAFTLMGMGMIFTWLAYEKDWHKTLDLMVQAAYKTMGNDVLIAIPLFVFMGYIVERANLIEKLFRSIHLALARVPGALAVATLVTCAVFATATGIVGAVVTLMGLLALPAMLRAGYSVPLSAGAITAGGCLGILIPPSVLLIVYGATAGVSVVQLYAGAFFPGIMLAGLYVLYVIILAKIKPKMAPPLSAEERLVPLPPLMQRFAPSPSAHALPAMFAALKGRANQDVPASYLLKQLAIVFMPLVMFAFFGLWGYQAVTAGSPAEEANTLQRMGEAPASTSPSGLAEPPLDGGLKVPADSGTGLAEPPAEGATLSEPPAAEAGLREPPAEGGVQEAPAATGLPAPPGAAGVQEPPGASGVQEPPGVGTAAKPAGERVDAPLGFWITLGVFAAILALFYAFLSFALLEVFKLLLTSFFPLMMLILSVLGSIVMGLATPTEAAAVGALGGFLLAIAYKQLTFGVVKESVFLTAKTSAMVCWLFVGSAIFSAAFALLGGRSWWSAGCCR